MTNPCRTGKPFNSYNHGSQRLLVMLLIATTMAVADRVLAEGIQSEENSVEFSIPAQSVPAALNEFARQAQVQLFFISDGFEGIQANAVAGSYPIQQALDLLLAGTGLAADYSSEYGVKVKQESMPVNSMAPGSELLAVPGAVASFGKAGRHGGEHGGADATQSSRNGVTAASDDEQEESFLEEIVVTGSSIRGVIPKSSPLEIYDAVDIRNTGAVTIEQFVSTLPQNNNTLSEMGTGNSSREGNAHSNNSIDLRGLGVGSTLVLLNGRRMAPSARGQSVDLSFIPIGVVERVEVLTDGASAIYGADAIGGVVNFVLQDQQDGAETVLTYGGAKGGNEQLRIDQSFGMNWADGNALIALSYFDRSELDAADRDFAQAAAPFTLIPEDTRRNLLATMSQLIPGGLTISGDLLYSTREPRIAQAQFLFGGDFRAQETEQQQKLLNLAVKRPFGPKLNGELLVTYADAQADASGFLDGAIVGVGPFLAQEDTSSVDITTKLDGELARFPSGALMFAVGAGHSKDEFREFRDFSAANGSAQSRISLDRDTTYAFAELLLPIASPEQEVSGIRRLELSLAARYTDYSDFGDDTSPKIGVLWSPVEQLRIRGTFGESFKAPFLFQKNPGGGQNALFPPTALGFPDIWTPDGSAIVLFAQGPGNPSLQAENAETATLGFDLDFSRASVTATYFNIEYTDRIAEPDPTAGFAVLG
ncbi:MAG: TonB-dependent receptor domain-containing protein, partial [Woeseiaceae bacterium]